MLFKKGTNRFYKEDELGNEIAEITYTPAGADKIIIDHTYVNDENRGQGIAEALVAEVVKMAREEQLKIIPLCPFAKLEFQKKAAYQEIEYKG